MIIAGMMAVAVSWRDDGKGREVLPEAQEGETLPPTVEQEAARWMQKEGWRELLAGRFPAAMSAAAVAEYLGDADGAHALAASVTARRERLCADLKREILEGRAAGDLPRLRRLADVRARVVGSAGRQGCFEAGD